MRSSPWQLRSAVHHQMAGNRSLEGAVGQGQLLVARCCRKGISNGSADEPGGCLGSIGGLGSRPTLLLLTLRKNETVLNDSLRPILSNDHTYNMLTLNIGLRHE